MPTLCACTSAETETRIDKRTHNFLIAESLGVIKYVLPMKPVRRIVESGDAFYKGLATTIDIFDLDAPIVH
jgi:hypothetical protein